MFSQIETLDWVRGDLNAIDREAFTPTARQGAQLAEGLDSRPSLDSLSVGLSCERLRDASEVLELSVGGAR